jgi:hypothetical protein
LSLPFAVVRIVVSHPTVVSASISPYEQWLVDGVAALCDVAPVGTLRAVARSSDVGPVVGHGGIGGLLVALAVVVVVIKRQEPKKTNQVS